jgi:anti-sigma factor RsiW
MKNKNEGPASSRGRAPGAPPTDLELMMWMDGELPDARASEVGAYVSTNARARAMVDSLRLGGGLIAAHAEQWADAHEAAQIADEAEEGAEGEASRRWMAPVKRAPAWRTPALAAFGLALAAAATFALFIRSVSRSHLPLDGQGATSMVAPGAAEESDTGSIAVVDFGSRPGAVLYLGWDGIHSAAVVWLTDDDPEDTQ